MLHINKAIIAERKQSLEKTRKILKERFIGIDRIIDDLLQYLQVWYLVPEILKRPVIINLWGMTGTGKTDLIRQMVKSLEFQDRFAEIELSNSDSTKWISSVSDVFEKEGIADDKSSIVLFDEIQRFNTLDEEGKPVEQTKFMDFWELLSDGRLSKKEKNEIDELLIKFLYRRKEKERKKAKKLRDKDESEDEEEILSYWEAQELQKKLGAFESLEALMDMPDEAIIELIRSIKKSKVVYEPINYSKMLIIISGNLDEAFQMADRTSEADVDADIFHSFTQKITMVDVKNALTQKFRPEQVARFGNIHLIYTSLRKKDFEQLIEREVERVIQDAKTQLGLELTVDSSIHKLIYRNGVFPVQGVRPVFSSVTDILEAQLSQLFCDALMNDHTHLHIKYEGVGKDAKIIATVGTESVKNQVVIPYIGRVDKIRQSNQAAAVANISVHEAGHAVAYMALMGVAPLQLKSKVASSYAAGFTFPHQIHETKRNLLNMIKIYLAGGIAEEVIFGAYEASVGRIQDREEATKMALDYVRRYGFDDEFQANYSITEPSYGMDWRATDVDVEKMMVRLVGETKELLNRHLELLKALSMDLALKGSMEAIEVAAVAKRYRLNVLIKEEGHLLIMDYDKKLYNRK
jgi:Peptidase family M41/ATPase family associated with various cellular activities (AAA)